MAETNLQTETKLATPTLQDELKGLAERAAHLEDAVRRAEAVLGAIDHGGLLDAAPRDPDDYGRHSSAMNLLDMLQRELRQLEKMEGTDLSISLSCLATDARHGRLTRMAYHPEAL